MTEVEDYRGHRIEYRKRYRVAYIWPPKGIFAIETTPTTMIAEGRHLLQPSVKCGNVLGVPGTLYPISLRYGPLTHPQSPGGRPAKRSVSASWIKRPWN